MGTANWRRSENDTNGVDGGGMMARIQLSPSRDNCAGRRRRRYLSASDLPMPDSPNWACRKVLAITAADHQSIGPVTRFFRRSILVEKWRRR